MLAHIAVAIVNYNNTPVEIYNALDLEFIPGKPQGYLDSSQAILDPGACTKGAIDGVEVHAPEGVKKYSVNSSALEMTQSGYIMSLSSHMHGGSLNLFNNPRN